MVKKEKKGNYELLNIHRSSRRAEALELKFYTVSISLWQKWVVGGWKVRNRVC